jgi:prepilin-type N-terminal cleavage/methylation domain-containing protein
MNFNGLIKTESSNKKSGFTLIELMIVIVVIGTIAGAGITAFVSFSRSQTIKSAVTDIKSKLAVAKSRAYSQLKPAECGDSNTLEGYEVRICRSDNILAHQCQNPASSFDSYEINARCSGNLLPVVLNGESYKLPDPNSYDFHFSSQRVFFFPVLTGGVVIEPAPASGDGQIVIEGYDQTAIITVDRHGNIK